jgi:hypothetical protein
MPKTILPCGLGNPNWPEIESSAFQTFISDYCISSSNRKVSRGYLNGLESLIEKAGPWSCIAKSCKIISLANPGKKTASPVLLQKAETLYFDLLPSFRTTTNEGKSTTIHSLMIAVLLGLYEVSMKLRTRYDTSFEVHRSLRVLVPNWAPMSLMPEGYHSYSHEEIFAI